MIKALSATISTAALFIFTGCQSTPTGLYKPHTSSGFNSGITKPNVPTTSEIDDENPNGFIPIDKPIDGDDILGKKISHPFENNLVYFAYDSAVVGTAYDKTIVSLAEYMKSNPSYILRIGGHCDERGSDEYNRALSERRALAIKEFIEAAAPSVSGRINTIGFGEEKLADQGTTADAHARNRRAVFVIISKR